MSAEYYIGRGNVYLQQKQYRKAIEEYKKALRVGPNYYWAWHNMGAAYYQLGDYLKAIECYEKILELYPNSSLAKNLKYAIQKCVYEEEKRKSIEKYVMVYDAIELELIAKKFGVNEDTVEDTLLDLIHSGRIKGTLTLVNGVKIFVKAKELEKQEIQCPRCDAQLLIDEHIIFCPYCAAKITED